jgi:hypothetical protein
VRCRGGRCLISVLQASRRHATVLAYSQSSVGSISSGPEYKRRIVSHEKLFKLIFVVRILIVLMTPKVINIK